MLLDDGGEVLAELGDASAIGNDLVDGLPQIDEQIDAVGAGDHVAMIVLGLPQVGPMAGQYVLLATEERDLLAEGQRGVGGLGHRPASCRTS